MTNPVKKYTKEEFIKKVKDTNTDIEVFVEEYKGVDTRYKYKCRHGISELYGWQLIKKKYCCTKGYHESRIPSLKKSINNRINEIEKRWGENYYILDNARFDPKERRKIIVECKIHGEFSQWTHSLTRQGVVNEACPECSKEINKGVFKQNAIKNFKPHWGNQASVSKNETKWLNELSVPERQVFLEDVFYTVDGYDPSTKTVYLYHGRFWHGCPETFDPEETHPVVGIKMKDLYEKTLYYENKIRKAGYNLITKWGD